MDSLSDYLAIKRGGWSEQTYKTYARLLAGLVGACPGLTLAEISDWLYRPEWRSNQRYVALKAAQGYVRWCCGDDHPALKMRVKRGDGPPLRVLSSERLMTLLSSFDTMTKKGVRDLAMCALMVDSGLRASEVCRLGIAYLDLVECRFSVKVKGGRWAEGVYSDTTARYLHNWLNVRMAVAGCDAVFTAIKEHTQLTREGLLVIVRKWGIAAGIGALSPHDLRRTFAVLSTRAGAPGRVLQAAGRWSSLAMVERYTRAIDAEDMRPYFPVTKAGL